jgi:hypothetical protein
MKELYTEVMIDAAAEHVFRILTDVTRYHEWNPLIVSAQGKVATGEKLDIRIRPPGKSDQPYVVEVLRVVPEREFVWLGHMKMRGILDGMHFFELFPQGANRVRVVHREEFRGLLVPLVWRAFLDTRMRDGFEAVNRSLKERAERPN